LIETQLICVDAVNEDAEELLPSDDSDDSSTCSTDSASDSEFENEEMDKEELEQVVLQVGADSRVTGFVLCQMKKETNCEPCRQNMSTLNVESHNFLNHGNERFPENPKLSYPSENFNACTIRGIRYSMESLSSISHETNLKKKLIDRLLIKINLSFGCPEHLVLIPELLAKRISLNCIRWFTRREGKIMKKRKTPKKNMKQQTSAEKQAKKDERINARRRTNSRRRSLNTFYCTIPVLAQRRCVGNASKDD
jgi:hypothetical protein